jgi:pectate lyase
LDGHRRFLALARATGQPFGALRPHYERLAHLVVGITLGGCGTDVAQTAVYESPQRASSLDCSRPSAPADLPDDPRFGGAETVNDNVLAAGDYGAGEGPGITVAALDAFRVFINGRLIATSTESLVAKFVPLTLLPGDNAVSIVVTARDRAPALLVELDELEKSYGSDATWKVSMDPADDFASATFDASSWDNALDRGAPAANPGCEPAGFPAGTNAHFIAAPGVGTAVFRLDVRIAPIGFASATTGGGQSEPVLATDIDAIMQALKSDDPKVVVVPEGTLDVRRTGNDVTDTSACPTACPDDPNKLTYNLLPDDATCPVAMVPVHRDERKITVGSNTTLVGLGRGAALLGGSLNVGASKNVIVRNLALYGVNPELIEAGDGITLDGADGVWVDHLTFWRISDGFIDSTTGSKNLTFSFVKNDGENPAACLGKHPRSNELSDTTATIHHTVWQHVDGRAPLATHSEARVHLFDDVVLDDPSYGLGSACGAQVVLEATSFQSVKAPTGKFDFLLQNDSTMVACADSDALGLIHAAGNGNVYDANVGSHQSNGMDTPEPADAVFAVPYAYNVEPADAATTRVLTWAGAGARWARTLEEPTPRP